MIRDKSSEFYDWDRMKAPTLENVDAKIVFYAVILRFGDIECTAEVIFFYIRHTK